MLISLPNIKYNLLTDNKIGINSLPSFENGGFVIIISA